MRRIAAVLLGLCVLFPMISEATSRNYVYIGGQNGKLWGVDVDSGETRLLTSSTVNTTAYTNALSANDNACIAYYGVGTTMYWWDETTDLHTQLSNLATDYPGIFTGGTLQSGGGTYWNATDSLFIGAEPVATSGDVEALYVASLDAAGTSVTGLTRIDIVAIAAADPETPVADLGGFGDLIVVDNGSGDPLIISATINGTTQYFWTFDVAASSFTLIKTGTENWQLAKTPDGRVWRGMTVSSVNTLQEIDISTGLVVGSPITVTGPSSIADLTAPACRPQIGIAKRASTPSSNGDGTYTVTFTLEIEAFEDFDLYDVQVTDDLATEFGTWVSGTPDDPGEFTVSSGPVVQNASGGAALTANSSFNGDGDQNILTLTSGDSLPIDSMFEVVFDVRFMPALGTTSWDNQAEATGDTREDGTADGDTDDLSDDGIDADPGDGDDGPPNDDPEDDDEGDPTSISLDSQIGVAKRAVSLTNNSDGTWTVEYSILVANLGALRLSDIRVTDNLTTEFGSPASDPDSPGEYAVVAGPTVSGQLGGATVSQSSANSGYDGDGDTVLIAPTTGENLPVGSAFAISLSVRFFPDPAVTVYLNQARATGDESDEDGVADEDTVDLSDDGTDPDPGDGNDGPPNGDPGDGDEDDPTEVEVLFSLESIPTLDEWGIAVLVLLLAGTAIRRLTV